MSEPIAENRGARAVLQNPNFRKLWVGQGISQIGDGLTNLAMLIVVNALTGSTAALAGVAIALALPPLFFGMGAGVVVDRLDRRRLMIVSDILRGIIVLGCILVRDPSQVWLFYLLAFLQATVGTFFEPAKNALIPQMVEPHDLLAANSLSQTTRVVTGVIGNALAGVLIGFTGSGTVVFSLDALSFFISAFFVWRIALPKLLTAAPTLRAGNALAQLTEGLRFVLKNRLIGTVMLTFSVTMLGLGAVNVLFVPFVVNVLKTQIAALGFLEGAQVAGMVIGSVMVAAIAARIKTKQLIAGSVFALGVLIALAGASPDAIVLGVLIVCVGFVVTPAQAAVATLMQREVPNEMRGRVSASSNSIITLSSLISMVLAGTLGDVLGIRQVFYLAGAIVVLASLLAIVMLRESPRDLPGFPTDAPQPTNAPSARNVRG